MRRRKIAALFRLGATLVAVLALGAGVEARAQDSTTSASPSIEPPPEAPAGPADKIGFGLMLDVGAPDGVGVSAVLRPVRWLRINAGVTTNTLSLGVRGGISLVPLTAFITPSINLDLGHYFDANYNELVDRFGGIPLQTTVPIDDVGFNYGGASLGLELGKPERFAVSLRVGLSRGGLVIEDADRLLKDVTGDPDVTAKPLSFRFTTPAVKLGFLLYLF